MTTDLCAEDVVVCIASPQAMVAPPTGGGGGGGEAGPVPRAASAQAELGRRLLLAARGGQTQLVLELMAAGAPFATDWLGTSALHLAAAHAHKDTCAVLLRAGVSRDARTKVERTPLHLAAYAGHAEVVQLLLAHGARADAADLLRMTPLHWAAAKGHADAAAQLLRKGADPAAVSKFRKTPRDLALRIGREDIVQLLDEAHNEPAPAADDTVHRVEEIKLNKPKQQQEKFTKLESKPEAEAEAEAEAGADAAAVLRRHGITLLPADGGTVLSALQAGRTVVLSDAGRRALRATRAAPLLLPPTPPKVKVLGLQGRLRPLAQDVQVKFVQLPNDAKKPVPMKAKARLAPRPPVKIIMNKSNYTKLIASANKPAAPAAAPAPEQERLSLRAELSLARRAVASLSAELASCRARLQQLEGPRP